MSTWLKLDSCDESIRLTSEKAFKEEIAWASHLSVPAIITPFPTFNCFNYARHLNAAVQPGSFLQGILTTIIFMINENLYHLYLDIQLTLCHHYYYLVVWVRVPLVSREVMVASAAPGVPATDPLSTPPPSPLDNRCRSSTWEAWNNLRSACNHHPSINVVLEMTADLPHPEDLSRWIGEPIKSIIIPTKIFLTNQRGYPTLTKRHQEFIGLLFSHDVSHLFDLLPPRPSTTYFSPFSYICIFN
jgi:protein arginine N-methyltransferase 5